ncbi:MAG: putative metallopeptidase [Candidatus Diapherotrites archaeon]|nr:putative metallopeptidase [Candidatus Diapherotrites archaeon]
MRYEHSEEWTLRAKEIAKILGMDYIDLERIACVKSQGSKSRRTIARIHTIGKVMQLGMQQKPFYTIELITEHFDKQERQYQDRTIVHELMHIPEGFKGGFRQHRPFVTQKTVEAMFQKLKEQTRI